MKKSIWLLKNGFIDVLGSDVHRLASNQGLISKKPSKKDHLDMILSGVKEKNVI